MRAQRQRREEEACAPVLGMLRLSQERARGLEKSLRSLETVVASKIGDHLFEEIGYRVGQELRQQIHKAVLKSGAGREPVTITIDPSTLAFMDPSAVERMVLDQCRRNLPSTMRVSADVVPQECATILTISLPSLHHRTVLAA